MQIKIEFESGFGKFADKYTVRRLWGNSVEEPSEFYMQSHTLHRIGDTDIYTANEANIDVTHQPFVDAIIALANVPVPTHENYPDHKKITLMEDDAKQAVKSAIVHPAIVEHISNPAPEYQVVGEGHEPMVESHSYVLNAAQECAEYFNEVEPDNDHTVSEHAGRVYIGDQLFAQEINANAWGGKRDGAGSGGPRPGAGRPRSKWDSGGPGAQWVMERQTINDLPTQPEMWRVLHVGL